MGPKVFCSYKPQFLLVPNGQSGFFKGAPFWSKADYGSKHVKTFKKTFVGGSFLRTDGVRGVRDPASPGWPAWEMGRSGGQQLTEESAREVSLHLEFRGAEKGDFRRWQGENERETGFQGGHQQFFFVICSSVFSIYKRFLVHQMFDSFVFSWAPSRWGFWGNLLKLTSQGWACAPCCAEPYAWLTRTQAAKWNGAPTRVEGRGHREVLKAYLMLTKTPMPTALEEACFER